MSGNISADPTRIRALRTSLVSLLEGESDGIIPAQRVRQGARLLIEAYQEILNAGSKQLVSLSRDQFRGTLHVIQSAYADWRDIDGAFAKALNDSYRGSLASTNLLLDTVHAELTRRVGDPLAALHARLHALWSEHLETSPWDEYLASTVHDISTVRMNRSLKALVHGDHLDIEDAVEDLTGPLRYTFAHFLDTRADSIELLEESMWLRPEIVVMNDYWRHGPQVRLLDILTRKTTRFSGAFATVQRLLGCDGTESGASRIAGELTRIPAANKEPYIRCLMLHPDQQVRRFAVNRTDIRSFWNVITPQSVPCATILSLLEKVAASGMRETEQKIFFRTIHRRLLNLTTRSDVIYARGIVRILTRLPFFMEDEYFEKLQHAIDYLRAKEKVFGLGGGVMEDYFSTLRREKDLIGTLRTDTPDLAAVPPVVLRKLARDGHFWHELASHPLFKIARETIPHIMSPDRALQVAKDHRVNPDVLRAVGRARSLFNTMTSKLELMANPHTPVAVSLTYLPDLTTSDVERLLRRSTVQPELRAQLQRKLGR